MMSRKMPAWARKLLARSVGHPSYPWVVALIALVSTSSFAFPFVVVLIPAVLLAPQRWLLLGVLSGLSSGLGGGLLLKVFHFMGQEMVIAHFPELLEWGHWQQASVWINDYGLCALALIAASPIPQTPAILSYSLAEPSLLGAMIAISIGKTIKYVLLAWLTVRYPGRFIAYHQQSVKNGVS